MILLLLYILAADHGQFGRTTPEIKQWFEGLQSGKGSCCSNADGRTISDADWESHNGHYRVRVPRYPDASSDSDMLWVDVPDEAVIKEPNRVGRTVVWPLYNPGYLVSIRCFMPGTMI